MWALCGLTFELSRPWRHGALAAKRMINMTGSRPRCHAGAGRLERRVRPHSVTAQDDSDWICQEEGRRLTRHMRDCCASRGQRSDGERRRGAVQQ